LHNTGDFYITASPTGNYRPTIHMMQDFSCVNKFFSTSIKFTNNNYELGRSTWYSAGAEDWVIMIMLEQLFTWSKHAVAAWANELESIHHT